MTFFADLHVHSKYSRATAKNLDLENLYRAAQLKGVTVVGTGDFTHPSWAAEIEEKLIPAESGLFRLRPELSAEIDRSVPALCRAEVRFILQAEISSIYKKDEVVRKNHNLVFFPDLETVKRFNAKLDRIGNIESDGRPILGLDAEKLLEMTLETNEQGMLIPAHVWTPWFSLFGSKSGFDRLDQCFGSLSGHIFAAETGLSSDPPMNWRIRDLDRISLISSSDAHSPMYLGRNATVFRSEISYEGIRNALETGDQAVYGGTVDMYPHQGKYHYDGHRKCNLCLNPEETEALGGICPECGKPLTLGVLHRVQKLAGRPSGYTPDNRAPYQSIVPMADLLSEIFEVGPKTKKVQFHYDKLLETIGPELSILLKEDTEKIEKAGVPLFARAVTRMREGRVRISPGFDGEYGKVEIFDEEERKSFKGECGTLFKDRKQKENKSGSRKKRQKRKISGLESPDPGVEKSEPADNRNESLNSLQEKAVTFSGAPLLVRAGPGTGKTRTLTEKIAYLINRKGVKPESVLALTFTTKAAKEMKQRIEAKTGKAPCEVTAATFHSFCRLLLKEYAGFDATVADEEVQAEYMKQACSNEPVRPDKADLMIQKAKQSLFSMDDDLGPLFDRDRADMVNRIWKRYQSLLSSAGLVDYEDLIVRTVTLLTGDSSLLEKVKARFRYILVDEYQDINYSQYVLVKALAGSGETLVVIGDPDQSIYGFRGSDRTFFKRFDHDFPGCEKIFLEKSYRSFQTILDASFEMISGQDERVQRDRILSEFQDDRKVLILETQGERAEAVSVGRMIEQLVGGTSFLSVDAGKLSDDEKKEFSFSDFAVLFRTKRQYEVFEDVFAKAGIPFQCAGRENPESPAANAADSEGDILNHDQDFWVPDAEKVSLMTIHASKGLEFQVVFVAGCEQGLIPFYPGGKGADDMDEERRLFYVAMTRAKHLLCLTYAKKRMVFGKTEKREKSIFLKNIRENLFLHRNTVKPGERKKKTPRQMELF
ncbi:MAG: UvrD-helicase domain-containing protein [Thermodesulfobacteriota bacterium]